jgi:hypothetical protein
MRSPRRGLDQHAERLATNFQRVQSISQGRRQRERAACVHACRRGLTSPKRWTITRDSSSTSLGRISVVGTSRQQALTIHELRHLAQYVVL